MADLEGVVRTTAWEPGRGGWRGWWTVANKAVVPPGAPIGAVSRSKDKLDVFVVGHNGQIYSAAWEPGRRGWRGWWKIGGNISSVPRSLVTAAAVRSPVTAVSRSENKLDVFATAGNGKVYTAAWEPGRGGWRGWWPVLGKSTSPATPINVVSRTKDQIDLVVADVFGRVTTAAWSPRFGWKGWWPIGSNFATGMSDPGVNSWKHEGDAFSGKFEDCQGMTTNGRSWYLIANKSKKIYKYSDSGKLQASRKITYQNTHIGDPGFFEGKIYVPLQGPHGVWTGNEDLSGPLRFHLNVEKGSDRFAWIDVNPLNGRLYTSECNHYNNKPGKLFAYDKDTFERRPEDDIQLGRTPIHFDRIQGGVFTRRGRVILTRFDHNGIFCFSSMTGHTFGGKELGDYGHGHSSHSWGSEMEGVTVRGWNFDGREAPVHVVELDRNLRTDGCYLHSYSVPDPAHL